MTKNIFVIGLDAFHRDLLQTVRNAEQYSFHGVLDYDVVVNPASYSIDSMLAQALADLKPYEKGGVDAIIGHWDFPTTTLLALLRREHGLRGPDLANVMIAENKYWCRLRQQAVAADVTPEFQSVNPFADDAEKQVTLAYPYWIKPVIAFSSQLAYKVEGPDDLRHALSRTREGIGRFGDPFREFMQWCDLPDDIPAQIDAYHCIVEQTIGGRQCTLEGYIRHGRPHVYAVIDSFSEGRHGSSFSRYQYPSMLPQEIQDAMIAAACRVIESLGLDDTPFNIEFYWDEEADRIWLLELNPRISKSHCPMFADVAGASHHEVAIDIALGREPDFPRYEGRFPMAAKFMLRRHRDGTVTRVPDEVELERLQKDYPGTYIQVEVEEGDRLSEMRGQDAYSFEVAVIFTGGSNEEELLNKQQEIKDRLTFAFDNGNSLDDME